MEKTIELDGNQMQMVANGATPRLYRSFFGKDVFRGLQKSVEKDGTIIDAEVYENLAFTMAIQGGSLPIGTKIDDWLASLKSPTAILEAAPEIMSLWNDNTMQISEGKKK